MAGSYHQVPQFELPSGQFTFLSCGEHSYTYNHLFNFAEWLDREYRPLQKKPEQPLLLYAQNSEETVFLIAACFLKQIPIFPIHPETPVSELENTIKSIQPFACYSGNHEDTVLSQKIPVITFRAENISPEELPEQPSLQFENPEQPAGYFLTSGSTGRPKVVPVKERQVLFGAASSAENLKPSPNKYWLLCLPLNHVGGINVIYRSILYGSAVYLTPSFDVENIRELLNENNDFEAASMVPTMLERLMENSFFRVQRQFKGLLIGGGPISMDLINRSLTRGLPIVTSYGMTETCAQIAANPMLRPSGMYIPKKSVGFIFKPNEIQIRDKNGQTLPWNEPGQIWLKGPQVFDGYLEPEQNKNRFDKDGWFNTGDFGHLNRQDQLFIESRRTDLIITGGENVNPIEIEEVLTALDSILEAAVVGMPDKAWGQKVTAFVVSKDEDFDTEAVIKKLKEKLPGYKIPKEIIVIDRIPKTPTQKIKRGELVRRYRN
jgi:o-succinylbenzoate---CoA ligase